MVTPFILAGLFLGEKAGSYLDERKAKICVMLMLIISGMAIVSANL